MVSAPVVFLQPGRSPGWERLVRFTLRPQRVVVAPEPLPGAEFPVGQALRAGRVVTVRVLFDVGLHAGPEPRAFFLQVERVSRCRVAAEALQVPEAVAAAVSVGDDFLRDDLRFLDTLNTQCFRRSPEPEVEHGSPYQRASRHGKGGDEPGLDGHCRGLAVVQPPGGMGEFGSPLSGMSERAVGLVFGEVVEHEPAADEFQVGFPGSVSVCLGLSAGERQLGLFSSGSGFELRGNGSGHLTWADLRSRVRFGALDDCADTVRLYLPAAGYQALWDAGEEFFLDFVVFEGHRPGGVRVAVAEVQSQSQWAVADVRVSVLGAGDVLSSEGRLSTLSSVWCHVWTGSIFVVHLTCR